VVVVRKGQIISTYLVLSADGLIQKGNGTSIFCGFAW
jgi:hypothetical protein